MAAYEELLAYAKARLAEREAAPGDDFLSRLVGFRDAGDLSPIEIEEFAVMLIEASTDNTPHQLAITVDRLLGIPGLWSSLGNNPGVIPGAGRTGLYGDVSIGAEAAGGSCKLAVEPWGNLT